MATRPNKDKIVRVLLRKHGCTFAQELGIKLKNPGPSALFRWLCAALLFSARISGETALEAAVALTRKGWTTPKKMAGETWAERTRTLNKAGYARYDERTSRTLGDSSQLLLDEYGRDLRRLREAAERDPARERELLKEFKGIGDVGADIFFREIQNEWDELAPFADEKALSAAKKLHLGNDAKSLARLVKQGDLPLLLVALVRCSLAKGEKAILKEASA